MLDARDDGGRYLGSVAVALATEGERYLGVGERGKSREKLKERCINEKEKHKNIKSQVMCIATKLRDTVYIILP